MKKLLLLLFLILVSLNSNGKEFNTLFGITLNDNAEKYVSSNYINSNKSKNNETLDGYFNLYLTDKIKVKSPYFSEYWLTLDMNNNIRSIQGEQEYAKLNRCQEFLKTLSSSLEEKYENDFVYWETPTLNGKKYVYDSYNSSHDYLSIQCNEDDNFPTIMLIYLETMDLVEAREEFYQAGL